MALSQQNFLSLQLEKDIILFTLISYIENIHNLYEITNSHDKSEFSVQREAQTL